MKINLVLWIGFIVIVLPSSCLAQDDSCQFSENTRSVPNPNQSIFAVDSGFVVPRFCNGAFNPFGNAASAREGSGSGGAGAVIGDARGFGG